MAPKRKQSSTNVTFDTAKFVSERAWKRFNAKKTKGFILERPLSITEKWHPDVHSAISARGWDSFCRHPEKAILSVVREFYSNGVEHRNGKIFVRGKNVSFSSSDINQIYGLPDMPEDDYSRFRSGSIDLDAVLKLIAVPGTVWKVSKDSDGEIFSIKKTSLLPIAKVWLYFIVYRLAPTKHLGDVTKARAVLIYTPMNGNTIDVGKVISGAILENITSDAPSFWFPTLVTSLCEQAGVQWDDTEEKLYMKSSLDNIAVRKIKRGPKTVDGEGCSNSHNAPKVSEESVTIEQRLEQLEHRQGKVERRQQRYAKHAEARDAALAAMMQACAVHMGMDMMTFPAMPQSEPDTDEDMEDAFEDALESI